MMIENDFGIAVDTPAKWRQWGWNIQYERSKTNENWHQTDRPPTGEMGGLIENREGESELRTDLICIGNENDLWISVDEPVQHIQRGWSSNRSDSEWIRIGFKQIGLLQPEMGILLESRKEKGEFEPAPLTWWMRTIYGVLLKPDQSISKVHTRRRNFQ